MIELAFPYSTGEWLAWSSAAICVVLGLVILIVPKFFMKFTGLSGAVDRPSGVSEIRGPLGGTLMGLGIAAILLAQPLVYAALGIALAGMVLGRLISMVFDGARCVKVLVLTLFEAVLAFMPLAYVFGLVA